MSVLHSTWPQRDSQRLSALDKRPVNLFRKGLTKPWNSFFFKAPSPHDESVLRAEWHISVRRISTASSSLAGNLLQARGGVRLPFFYFCYNKEP